MIGHHLKMVAFFRDIISPILQAMQDRQKIIIITAPSGAGKSTITKFLLNKYPQLAFSISATTRLPRGIEQHGVEYYFLTEQAFTEKIHADDFIEWEMVYAGKYYGTLKSEVNRIWDNHQYPILDIDVKGAMHVMQLYPKKYLSIFINVPSIEILKKRLMQRGTETDGTIATRIEKAAYEISHQHHFNHVIMNDELSKACADAEALVKNFLDKQ